MSYSETKHQFLVFVRLFLILFILLFILPELIDFALKNFILYQIPRGNSILVTNYFYKNMSFTTKYLTILKSLIFSL